MESQLNLQGEMKNRSSKLINEVGELRAKVSTGLLQVFLVMVISFEICYFFPLFPFMLLIFLIFFSFWLYFGIDFLDAPTVKIVDNYNLE